MGEWTNKLYYIHTMEEHRAVEKNEQELHASTVINLETQYGVKI